MLKDIKKEWEACTKIKIFEFKVLDKRTNSLEWLTFDIDIVGRSFIAKHVALTKKQEKSKLVATTKLVIDSSFSLDENLHELHSACVDAITDSEFYMFWGEHEKESFAITLLPDYFADYLINNDSSSLSDEGIREIDKFIADQKLGHCMGILYPHESNFREVNALNNTGADCLHYIFEKGLRKC